MQRSRSLKVAQAFAFSVVVAIAAASAIAGQPQAGSGKPLEIRKGSAVTLDGNIAAGEWDDAGKLDVKVSDSWTIAVRYKHDGGNLLFAFQPVQQQPGNRAPMRFPEVLLDSANAKSSAWQPGQWWFHTSFSDCDADGEFNLYNRDGKFLCAKQKPGWDGNNWPLQEPYAVEMTISFAKVGVKADAQRRIGLAFNLTDTQKLWSLWPASAKLESPASWGEAVIVP